MLASLHFGRRRALACDAGNVELTTTMQQLDIFADSRDRVLVNALADAVAQRDIGAAQAAAADLAHEFADDRHLGPAAVLIEAMQAQASAADGPLPGLAAALSARETIEQRQRPAAHSLLGAAAAATWLAQSWRALAQRARALPFEPSTAQGHATALWLQSGDWAQAAQAAQGIESWRRKPQPLAWMAQATWRQAGPDAAWPLLAELAWLAPPRVPLLLPLLPDTRMHKLARAFEDVFDELSDDAGHWAWWPAWLLVEQPLLGAPLEQALTDSEAAPPRAFRMVQSLLRLERQGRHADIVSHRKQLQALHAGLFAAYMLTR